jgi:hypothetical protein
LNLCNFSAAEGGRIWLVPIRLHNLHKIIWAAPVGAVHITELVMIFAPLITPILIVDRHRSRDAEEICGA